MLHFHSWYLQYQFFISVQVCTLGPLNFVCNDCSFIQRDIEQKDINVESMDSNASNSILFKAYIYVYLEDYIAIAMASIHCKLGP